MPASNKAISVDAGKEAGQVLVVYQWCGFVIKGGGLEELDEVEYVSLGQVVWEGSLDQLVQEHRSEGSREEADDRTAGMELFFRLGGTYALGIVLCHDQETTQVLLFEASGQLFDSGADH